MLLSFLYYERFVMLLFRRIPGTVDFILKEDDTPTSIGGELHQFRLGGRPISFQDKASGGSQAWSVEECFAFDHAAARTPEAFLNSAKDVPEMFP